jgi:predicted protein tyrosine phosphatase
VGKAKSVEQTVEHVKVMMANLDADALVSVRKNKQELAEKMNIPEQGKRILCYRRFQSFILKHFYTLL